MSILCNRTRRLRLDLNLNPIEKLDHNSVDKMVKYGVATISRLLYIINLFCRIWSLL